MFRRRRATDRSTEAAAESAPAESDAGVSDSELGIDDAELDRAAVGGDDDDDSPIRVPPRPRPNGPWDANELADDDETVRIDLGTLRIPGVEGMEIRVELDESSGSVVAVTAVLGDAAVQVQPFAAPRTEGIWADVRQEIRGQIGSGGGLVDEQDGPFGPELRTQVPAQLPDGSPAVQPARFVGIDGPRWFLRAVFLGQAALGGDGAEALEDIVRGMVVVRGAEAKAPGDPLVLTLPQDPNEATDEGVTPQTPGLNPFERGPEITEIR